MTSHERDDVFESPETGLFVQQFVHRKSTKSPHITGPLWWESTGDWGISLIKGQQCGKRFQVIRSSWSGMFCWKLWNNPGSSLHFFSLQIRVDSYHRGNSATTPLESHDEAPLTLRIENVISINPDLAQDNASALSWKVKASDKENPEHLCQAEITPFCLKGGESDDSLAQSRKRKRNES